MMPHNNHPPAALRLLLRLHPLHRIALSLAFAGLVLLAVSSHTSSLVRAMLAWIVFAFTYLLQEWLILFNRSITDMRRSANSDDGSKLFVFLMVLMSSFAGYAMVLFLMMSQSGQSTNPVVFVVISLAGILLSWFMVHTLYTFHYAHMYYNEAPHQPGDDARGLGFPQEAKPDYIDFAYFSFGIGCTFQVSDVQIISRSIRRVVLAHQLISFGINTIVVALTINLVAGLR